MMSSQGGGRWLWRRLHGERAVSTEIVAQIQDIFRDGFNRNKGWGEDSIRKRLSNSGVLGLLETRDGLPSGYAIYSSPEEKLDGGFVLWEDAICIRRSLQGKGASRTVDLLKELASAFGREFAWFGGVTQNPAVYKRYARLGRVFPVDEPFASNDGKQLLEFLYKNVPQVKDRSEKLDDASGAFKGIYSGRLGQYEVGMPGAEAFEEYLRRQNVNREAGDAVLLVSKLRASQ
jgi:hypothetical protein